MPTIVGRQITKVSGGFVARGATVCGVGTGFAGFCLLETSDLNVQCELTHINKMTQIVLRLLGTKLSFTA